MKVRTIGSLIAVVILASSLVLYTNDSFSTIVLKIAFVTYLLHQYKVLDLVINEF
jgi:hypothetical protein